MLPEGKAMSASLIFGLFYFTSWQSWGETTLYDWSYSDSLLSSSQFFSPAFWLCTTPHYLNVWISLTTKTTTPNLFRCSFVAKQLRGPTSRNSQISKKNMYIFLAQWATCVVNFDNSLVINHGLTNSWGRMPDSVNWYFISPTCLNCTSKNLLRCYIINLPKTVTSNTLLKYSILSI